MGGTDSPAKCLNDRHPEYLANFDPPAVDLRSIFWLLASGGPKAVGRRHQGRNSNQFLFRERVRNGYSEGGQAFSAARIGHRGDPMSRKDAILNMRQILIKRRDALRKALAGDLSLLKELRAQTSGDMVDAALDSVQDEISSQLAEVESRELTRIEYALERMREGQFGICEGCGTSIPMARLNALPYATYCITCQREAERQGGGFGRGRRLEPAAGFLRRRRRPVDQRHRVGRLVMLDRTQGGRSIGDGGDVVSQQSRGRRRRPKAEEIGLRIGRRSFASDPRHSASVLRLRCSGFACSLAGLCLPPRPAAQTPAALPAAIQRHGAVDPEQRAALRRELERHAEVLEAQSAVLKIVAKLVGPAVVHVEADVPPDRQYDQGRHIEESGSGVIVEFQEKHYVLTNWHVIHDADAGRHQNPSGRRPAASTPRRSWQTPRPTWR